MLDSRNVAEEITAADKQEYPDYSADNILMRKGQVVHFAYACDEGREGAHDGDEAC